MVSSRKLLDSYRIQIGESLMTIPKGRRGMKLSMSIREPVTMIL